MSSSSDNSLPYLPENDSPGSSVSSSLQKEYEELLKYAVVTPKIHITENVYEKGSKDQPSRGFDNGGLSSDESSKYSASSSSKQSTSDSSQSNYVEETSDVVREGVVGLPRSSGVPLSISLMGQGSLARDSLLRDESAATSNGREDDGHSSSMNDASPSEESPSSDKSDESPIGRQRSPGIDADLARMEALLDSWCLDLKRNVLAELAQCKMGLFEKQKHIILQEKRRHMADRNKLLNEMESQKELLYTYEQSINHKDSIVANMTSALQRQRDKFELLKGFSQWKVKHNDENREAFTDKLSQKHYDHKLKAKAWSSWRQLIESQWKNRVERACQTKAQDVCVKLTEDYETKLEKTNHELEQARQEIAHLHAEREVYEETMKKAFMRGVCALNLEAMTMFREGEEGGRQVTGTTTRSPASDQEDTPRSQAPAPSVTSTGIPSNMPGPPSRSGFPPRSQAPAPSVTSTGIPSSMPGPSSRSGVPYKPATQAGGRRITVKATGREDLKGVKGGAGLIGHQGPVSSILVQRHTSESSGPSNLPPTRQQPPTTTSMRTTKSRPLPVKTVHTTPLKVVH